MSRGAIRTLLVFATLGVIMIPIIATIKDPIKPNSIQLSLLCFNMFALGIIAERFLIR